MVKGHLSGYQFSADGYYCVPVYTIPGDFVDSRVAGTKICYADAFCFEESRLNTEIFIKSLREQLSGSFYQIIFETYGIYRLGKNWTALVHRESVSLYPCSSKLLFKHMMNC